MNKSLSFIVFSFLFVTPAFMPAQTAAELETLLETPAITCAQAAQFVFACTEPAESAAIEAAFEQALANHWFPKDTAAGDPLTLGTLSFLMMKAFNMKGGLMYAILPGSRYAFRIMVSRSLIQGTADPAMTVSGERFLHILGNILAGEES
jgi:hypothetical protein